MGSKMGGAMESLMRSEAKEVFRFFTEICEIPHGSGNVGRISDYLVAFAKSRGLAWEQDEIKNVIIFKEATPGYEGQEPLLLQGHMDMVAVKEPGCDIDMKTEGLVLDRDGDWLYARDTSLGGDDGIAVAYMLALLDADQIAHPRLEAVFTVDEETGMDGARAIDLSRCRGRRMLNLDSEDEGIFLTSCAGGARIRGSLPVKRREVEGTRYDILIGGLQGGHSGGEIHKERGNSNCLAGRLLWECQKAAGLHLLSMEGGLADNAIPRQTRLAVVAAGDEADALKAAVRRMEEALRTELAVKDPGVYIDIEEKEKGRFWTLREEDAQKAAFLLLTLPNGVQTMSADIPGLVQTSLNLGILRLEKDCLVLEHSVRSSLGSEKALLLERVRALFESCNASWEVSGDYPAWEYKKDSALRERLIAVYEKMFGHSPKVEAIHAGLECGILSAKLEGLDCVSLGPQMRDIHTTKERLSISSVERVWRFLLAVLAVKED